MKHKLILVILLLAIFIQSCSVYVKADTLQEASLKPNKVKLYTKSGEKTKFNSIVKQENGYVGTKKVEGGFVQMPINEDEITKVKVKDKARSILVTLLFLGGLAIITPAVAFAAGGGVL